MTDLGMKTPTPVDDVVTPLQPEPSDGSFGHSVGRRLYRLLVPVWRDQRVAVAVGFGIAALWGLIAGWWTPRSPLTTSAALWSMLISAMVGVIAGLVMRSRWAMLSSPVVFAVAFEVVRLDLTGPTVDGVQFSTYGIFALVVGRGFHALVALIPMLLGAAIGAGTARRLRTDDSDDSTAPFRHPIGLYMRRMVAVLTGIGLIVLAAGLARPATDRRDQGP